MRTTEYPTPAAAERGARLSVDDRKIGVEGEGDVELGARGERTHILFPFSSLGSIDTLGKRTMQLLQLCSVAERFL